LPLLLARRSLRRPLRVLLQRLLRLLPLLPLLREARERGRSSSLSAAGEEADPRRSRAD